MNPAGGAALGSITNYVTPPPSQKEEKRVKRFVLQAAARQLLPDERVSFCLRRLVHGKQNVEIRHSPATNTAHIHNVTVCGSVWTCPVCAAKITEARRIELAKAIDAAHGKLTPILVTLTLQHDREDSLTDLLEYLNESFRALRRGDPWKRITARWSLEASITALEATWSEKSGWHPHKHLLLFSALPEGSIDVEALQKALATRWKAILEKSGRYASLIYGLDVRVGNDQAADYVGKWGLEFEITKAPVKQAKGGYSPFQLLDLYAAGKIWAGALFKEYAAAMKGRRQLVFGKGSREALGLVEQEATDEELAKQEEGGSVVLVSLAWRQYEQVLAHQVRRPGVLGELLQVAGRGDAIEVWSFLGGLGVIPTQHQADLALFHGANVCAQA